MTTTNIEILAQLKAVNARMEEIAAQGRENNNELKMLRRELGLEPNGFGRVPTIEGDIKRQDLRSDKIELRVDLLEKSRDVEDGKARLVTAGLGLVSGSAGAALIYLIAHAMGIHW